MPCLSSAEFATVSADDSPRKGQTQVQGLPSLPLRTLLLHDLQTGATRDLRTRSGRLSIASGSCSFLIVDCGPKRAASCLVGVGNGGEPPRMAEDSGKESYCNRQAASKATASDECQLVEPRGFEPLTSSVRGMRSPS